MKNLRKIYIALYEESEVITMFIKETEKKGDVTITTYHNTIKVIVKEW